MIKPSRESIVQAKEFFKTPAGIELRRYIEGRIPKSSANTIEGVALEAKHIEGFRDCMDAIFVEFATLPLDDEKSPFMDMSDEVDMDRAEEQA